MSDSNFAANDVSSFEASVMGQILKDSACYDEAGLTQDHFLDPKLRLIMKAVEHLKSKGSEVDELLLEDCIKPEKLRALGGIAYISSLITNVSTTGNVGFHAGKVRDAWLQRQCGAIHGELSSLSRRGASGDEMLDAMRTHVDKLEGTSSHRPPTMAEAYITESELINGDIQRLVDGEALLVGLPSGLGLDDVVPGGIPIDKVTLLFGESGNYKTTTKNNIVWGIACSGLGSILDVSLEDANQLTVQRFIARQTGLPYGAVATRKLSADDAELVSSVAPEALDTAGRIILGGDLPPDFDGIVRLARHYKRTRGLVAVVVDYLQLLDEDDDNERIALKKILKKAQQSAKRDRIAYIFLSQVGQQVESRAKDSKQSSRPGMNDMIGSSWMKFAAKLMIGVFRPAKYEPIPKKPRCASDPDYTRLVQMHPKGRMIYQAILELHVKKNILGEADVIVLCLVNAKTGRMYPLPAEYKEYIT